jgi:hypothetical protein
LSEDPRVEVLEVWRFEAKYGPKTQKLGEVVDYIKEQGLI